MGEEGKIFHVRLDLYEDEPLGKKFLAIMDELGLTNYTETARATVMKYRLNKKGATGQ